MTTSKQSFEFEGPNALETAKNILSNYEISGDLQRISVELEEKHELEGGTEGNEQSAEEDNRELKQIRPDTNHHKVLTTVKELEQQGESPVSGTKVYENVENVKEGSVFASLSKLWNRRLVERERVKEGSQHHYVYEISGYGDQELSRIGMWES